MTFQMTGSPGPWQRRQYDIRSYERMIERGLEGYDEVPDYYYNDPRPNDFRDRDKITAMVEGFSRPITFRVKMIGEGYYKFPVAYFTKDGISYYISLPDAIGFRQQPVPRDTVWTVTSSRASRRKPTKRLTKEERGWYDRQVFNWIRAYGLKKIERYERALAEHERLQEQEYNWYREESWNDAKHRYYRYEITPGDAYSDIFHNESGRPVWFGRFAQKMGVDLTDLSEAAQTLARDDGKTSRNAISASLKRLAKKGALATMGGETSRGRETTAYYYGPVDQYWEEYYPDQVVALAAYEGAE